MPELKIQFDIPLTMRSMQGVMVLSLLAGLAGDLSSESVTLTTFYPAPSGVYGQLISAQNVYLARDAYVNPGGAAPKNPSYLVEVGTYFAPTSPSATRFVVNGGLAGIGTTNMKPAGLPTATTGPGCPMGTCPALQIYDNVGNNTVDLLVNGRIMTGDPLNATYAAGGVCVNPTCTQIIGNAPSANSTMNFGILSMTGGPVGLVMTGNSIGIGFPGTAFAPGTSASVQYNPVAPLDVYGDINIPTTCSLGVSTFYPGTPMPLLAVLDPKFCPAGNYATYRPGLMTYYQTSSDHTDDVSGTMWCCPCPNGVCSL